jgi:hypothetical protein
MEHTYICHTYGQSSHNHEDVNKTYKIAKAKSEPETQDRSLTLACGFQILIAFTDIIEQDSHANAALLRKNTMNIYTMSK